MTLSQRDVDLVLRATLQLAHLLGRSGGPEVLGRATRRQVSGQLGAGTMGGRLCHAADTFATASLASSMLSSSLTKLQAAQSTCSHCRTACRPRRG